MAPKRHISINLFLFFYEWLKAIVLALVPKRWRYKSIDGEIALVTGGGSGLGRQLAIRLAKFGAKIVLWDLNLESVRETAKIIEDKGGEAYAYKCDVSKSQNVYDAADKVKREVGKVTILVNNAGVVTGKLLLDCPDDKIKRTFEVNALAHFWTCKAFLPGMMEDNHGHIVSITSIAGLGGGPRAADYCASKFAAVGFEESLRNELIVGGYTGIHSTVVCPYLMSTGMFDGARPGIVPISTPESVAKVIVSAVLVNQEVLFLPKFLTSLAYFLKCICPPSAVRILLEIGDFFDPMISFTGRKNAKKE